MFDNELISVTIFTMTKICGLFIFDKNQNVLMCVPFGGVPNSRGYTIPKAQVKKGEIEIQKLIKSTSESCGLDFRFVKEEKFKEIGEMKYPKSKKTLKAYSLNVNFDLKDCSFTCTKEIQDKPGCKKYIKFAVVSLDKAINSLHKIQSEILAKYKKKLEKEKKRNGKRISS